MSLPLRGPNWLSSGSRAPSTSTPYVLLPSKPDKLHACSCPETHPVPFNSSFAAENTGSGHCATRWSPKRTPKRHPHDALNDKQERRLEHIARVPMQAQPIVRCSVGPRGAKSALATAGKGAVQRARARFGGGDGGLKPRWEVDGVGRRDLFVSE